MSTTTELLASVHSIATIPALRTTNSGIDDVFNGLTYTFNNYYTIASATTKYFLFDPTVENGVGKVIAQPLTFHTSAGAVTVNIRTGHDYTGGTVVQAVNRDNNSTKTPNNILTQDPTGSDTGASILGYLVGSDSTPLNSGGGFNNDNMPFVINKNIKYLLEIINLSGEEIIFELRFTWVELK